MLWALGVGIALLFVAAVPYVVCFLFIRILDLERNGVVKQQYEPRISIVIPTHKEENIIEGRLQDLLEVEYPKEKLEYIIVDTGADDTANLARQYLSGQTAPDFVILEEGSRSGVAAAVNRGVEVASGELIFRTDCDSRTHDQALIEAAQNFADNSVGGVTGRQSEFIANSEVERDYRDLQTRLQMLESRLDSTFIVHGPCFMFRKDLFREIPPVSLADDSEIAVNIRRQGHRVILDPEVNFSEAGTSDFRGRRKRKDRRAMGLLDLLQRNKDAVGRFGLYGSFVIPMNFWMMWLSPWFGAIGTVSLLLGSLIVGPIALIFPFGLVVGFWLGQRERLGRLQPLYAVADSLVSLLIASLKLRSERDGTWEIDEESRQEFE